MTGRAALVRAAARLAAAVLVAAWSGGCVLGSQLVPPQPSAVTQQLVMRAFERAVDRLDVEGFRGTRVSLDVYTQIATQPIVRAYVASALESRGVRIVTEAAEFNVRVFVSALGTDHGETFLGIPAFQAPVVNLGIPEIAFFKWARNRGLAEVSLFAFDGRTGDFVVKGLRKEGRSKQDDFVVLIVIGWTVSDLSDQK